MGVHQSLFGKIISRQDMIPDPRKLKAFNEMFPQDLKKELQAFLGIINYLSKFSTSTTEEFDLIRWLHQQRQSGCGTPAIKNYLTMQNQLYIQEDICMKFYEDEATICGNRCIWTRTWCQPTTDKRRYKLSLR